MFEVQPIRVVRSRLSGDCGFVRLEGLLRIAIVVSVMAWTTSGVLLVP